MLTFNECSLCPRLVLKVEFVYFTLSHSRQYCYFYCIGEEINADDIKEPVQGHRAGKWQSPRTSHQPGSEPFLKHAHYTGVRYAHVL
jgi:hypothetical protein